MNQIQLMRPALLAPFLEALDKRGMDADGLMRGPGLSRESIVNNEGLVSAKHAHQFIARSAESVGEPYFCWELGWSIDHSSFPLFADLPVRCHNLADIFTEMAVNSALYASATRFELHIAGPYSQFRSERFYRPDPIPRYADCFSIGMITSLIARYAGHRWSAHEVSLETTDPELIPKTIKVRRSTCSNPRRLGFIFPTEWLRQERDPDTGPDSSYQSAQDRPELLHYLHTALAPLVDNPALTAREAAEFCGLGLLEINQHLAQKNMTLASFIESLRSDKARELLLAGDLAIAEVGRACGYPDAASFSRAFRRWEGTSASEFCAAIHCRH